MKNFKEAKHTDIKKQLNRAGFENIGGTKHEKWRHVHLNFQILLPRHKSISPGVSKSIYKTIAKATLFSN